jgi:hypothetical protein
MKCDLIAPFRVNLAIPKYYVRAYPQRWQVAFETAETALTAEPTLRASGATLGNYGGARLCKLHENARTLYGEEGVHDPGFFFKEHHLLLLTGTPSPADDPPPELDKGNPLSISDCFWECRFYDSNLAVLVLGFRIENLETVKSCSEAGRYRFTRWTDKWVDKVIAELCSEASGQVLFATDWLQKMLIQPFIDSLPGGSQRHWRQTLLNIRPWRINGEQNDPWIKTDILALGANPIYAKPYQRLWSHGGYSIEESELTGSPKTLTQELVDSLTIFLSKEIVEEWPRAKGCHYGFGTSLRQAKPSLDPQWREAASVSQYYYTCLDIADTGLPSEIARQRALALDGRSSQVMADTEQLNILLQVLQNDYADIRLRASSEAGRVLTGYHDSWRVEGLLKSIDKKMSLLRQLTESANANLQKKNDDMMNIILFIIGVLGLVSLFTGLHDYLSGGTSTRFYDDLPEIAMSLGKSDVLMGALLVILAALAAFFFYRRSR